MSFDCSVVLSFSKTSSSSSVGNGNGSASAGSISIVSTSSVSFRCLSCGDKSLADWLLFIVMGGADSGGDSSNGGGGETEFVVGVAVSSGTNEVHGNTDRDGCDCCDWTGGASDVGVSVGVMLTGSFFSVLAVYCVTRFTTVVADGNTGTN